MATYNGMDRAKGQFAIQRILVDGDTATTALTATGLGANDKICWINHFSTKAAIATLGYIDLDEVTVAANSITLSTTDTSNDQLEVVFIPVDL